MLVFIILIICGQSFMFIYSNGNVHKKNSNYSIIMQKNYSFLSRLLNLHWIATSLSKAKWTHMRQNTFTYLLFTNFENEVISYWNWLKHPKTTLILFDMFKEEGGQCYTHSSSSSLNYTLKFISKFLLFNYLYIFVLEYC